MLPLASRCRRAALLAPCVTLLLATQWLTAQDRRAMTFEDVMKFERIVASSLSATGNAVAYEVAPDRGDGYVVVRDLMRGVEHRVERGTGARFNESGTWAAIMVKPEAFAKGDKKDKPRQGMALIELATGRRIDKAKVRSVAFSKDGLHVAWHHEGDKPGKGRRVGSTAVAWQLGADDDAVTEVHHVIAMAFDPKSRYLDMSVAEPTGQGNGVYRRVLTEDTGKVRAVLTRPGHVVPRMAWNEAGTHLAAVQAPQDKDGDYGDAALMVVTVAGSQRVAWSGALGKAWVYPDHAPLRWAKDADVLLTGFADRQMSDHVRALAALKKARKDEDPADPFDVGAIVDDRRLDVWHWNDDSISPHQKQQWGRESRRTYAAAWTPAGGLVHLADHDLPSVSWNGKTEVATGTHSRPYAKEVTWDGRYRDVYLVDPTSGERALVLARQGGPTSLSTTGRHLVYWLGTDWRAFNAATGRHRNLTSDIEVRFANEDHDYPSAVPGYGVAGWNEAGTSVYVYDKYDIWRIDLNAENSAGFTARCVTNGIGRENQRVYRIVDTDREVDHIPDGPLLLSSYHDKNKNWGMWRLDGRALRRLVESDHKYSFLGASKDGKRVLFSRESYREFPDLWVADADLANPQRVSNLGGQTAAFNWGNARLVDWKSADGRPLQGVLITPEGHKEGERLPVLVYYYRFFSQRLHEFNQVVVNHRPCFPYYVSNGYAVFLPDIRFDIGNPGYAATKCLVPGIQKLIDMGVADPDGVGLHGHSWSGYQTAHVITQTNMFACAIAGAPVSNMTSAYGGIRWGSGVSRQFQYEKTQSRIGASLWERRDLYIDNSPVFFADRIETPLLIQFGDEDGAVPWYQGIELYMAMRRLGKDCVFLQYRGEPHHLKQYPNKLDYSIKMHEYLDHYCKGAEAPVWIEKGAPYRGR